MVVVHILDVIYAFHSFGFGRFETIMRNASLRCKCLECSPSVSTKDVLPGDPRCNVLFQMAGQDPTTAHRLAKRLFRPVLDDQHTDEFIAAAEFGNTATFA